VPKKLFSINIIINIIYIHSSLYSAIILGF
jgi:hypothetical protein